MFTVGEHSQRLTDVHVDSSVGMLNLRAGTQ
jgi:hypothetical protein